MFVKKSISLMLLVLFVVLMMTTNASAVPLDAALGTSFTYQGKLSDGGAPAKGTYDLQFTLYDALSDGSQVGSTVTLDYVPVTDGLFTVQLDFGIVFDGTALYLEIGVRPGGSVEAYTTLTPRQPLSAAPYATYATQSSNADLLDGLHAGNFASASHTHWGEYWNGSGIGLTLYGGYTGLDATGSLYGVNAMAGNGSTGIGVLASGGIGVRGTGANIGVSGAGATGVIGTGVNDTGGSVGVHGSGSTYGVSGSGSGAGSIGVYGSGSSAGVYAEGGTYGVQGYGDTYGVRGDGLTGVMGSGLVANGTGVKGQGNIYGVYGDSNGGSGVYGNSYYGTGVYGNGPTGIYGIGTIYAGHFTGDVQVDGNFTVSGGTKSAAVQTKDYGTRSLYAVESPENWFEDFGTGQLADGTAVIPIEPVFAETVNLSEDYHIFLTPLGDCALYVGGKSATSFTVRAMGGQTCSIAFDYRIVAKRLGYEDLRLAAATDTEPVATSAAVGK